MGRGWQWEWDSIRTPFFFNNFAVFEHISIYFTWLRCVEVKLPVGSLNHLIICEPIYEKGPSCSNCDFINHRKSPQNHLKITQNHLEITKVDFKVILSDFEMILRWFWVIYKITIIRWWALFTNSLTYGQNH